MQMLAGVKPEAIRPDRLSQALTDVYRRRGPSEAVALLTRAELDPEGRITAAAVLEARPPDLRLPNGFEAGIVRALRGARFRPARKDDLARSGAFDLQIVFHPELGLIPAVPPAECRAAEPLLEGPSFVSVDEPAKLATPAWERSRIIHEVWPVALQEGKHEYRLWLLVDRRGRVCRAQPIQPVEDRWIRSKLDAIAKRLHYVPARDEGAPTAVWHQEMLVFSF